MALDARIPLMAQGMNLEPRANALMRGIQMQGAQQQNALRQMQMQQMQAAAQQAMAEREAQAKRQSEIDAYLSSMSGQAGPPQPFNPVEALMRTKSPEMVKQLQGVFQPQKKLTTVAPGAALVDEATGQPVYTAPDREAKNPAAVQEYEYAKTQGYKGSFEDWTTGKARAGATSVTTYGSPVPVMLPDGAIGYAQPGNKAGSKPQMMTDATGKPMVKPGDGDKPLTEGQAKAMAFASRMQSADQTLAQLARKGVNITPPGAMGNNAIGSAITATLPADQQQLAQAKRDFINAALRRESGAVISADEFANAERQYFPQIGDSRQVIEQKARNRRIAIEGIKADVPAPKRGEVDRIANPGVSQDDPLGLRK